MTNDTVIDVEDRWRRQLEEGGRWLGIELTQQQTDLLIAYLQLLQKWNRVFNLTAVRDGRELVRRHLVDSLSVEPMILGPRVADVGTGAGLPGIPLAILRPDWRLVLLDANSKKTRFLTQVKLELGLENLEVVHARLESYKPEEAFNSVTSRAFSSLADFWRLGSSLIRPDGRLVAMKGRRPDEELSQLPAGIKAEVFDLPTDDRGERHIVVLQAQELG